MRCTLLLFACLITSMAQGQFFGLGLWFDRHQPINTSLNDDLGFNFSVGAEGYQLKNRKGEELKLCGSFRYTVGLSYSPDKYRVDSIDFEVPSGQDPWGFGTISFRRLRFQTFFDLGFVRSEGSVFEPFVSLGLGYNRYDTSLKYALYNPDSCVCYDASNNDFTTTHALGLLAGIGFKIRLKRSVHFVFRTDYAHGITIKNGGNGMPDMDKFYIDHSGSPQTGFSESRAVRGIGFNIGIIFKLSFDADDFDLLFEGDYDYDDDDDDDDDDWGGGSRSSGGSSEDCDPVILSPKPSKNK